MMYYCPCPCGEPVDPDPEESTFLSLPRNLSYVKESYLDEHDVSGRFVYNAQTEKRTAAATFAAANGSSPSTSAKKWRADAPELEALCLSSNGDADNDGGVNGSGARHHHHHPHHHCGLKDYKSSCCRTEGNGSCSCSCASPVVKSQDFQQGFQQSQSSTAAAAAEEVGSPSPTLGHCHSRLGGFNNNSSSSAPTACVSTSSPSPPAVEVEPTSVSASAQTTSGSSIVRSAPSSILSRVTSLLSSPPTDEPYKLRETDGHDISSSVDGELTSDLVQPGPSLSVLRSPDRSGLVMDRGDDLDTSPSHDDYNNIDEDDDDHMMTVVTVTTHNTDTAPPPDDDVARTSTHGPEVYTEDDDTIVVDTGEEEEEEDDDNGKKDDDTLSDPIAPDYSNVSSNSNSDPPSNGTPLLGLEKTTKPPTPQDVIRTSLAPESSESDAFEDAFESDAFSEEGVFVNMMDEEADVLEETTDAVREEGDNKCASEVSDDTNVSVDSMFWSPEEGEPGEEDQKKLPKQMSLEEAISKAAADFDKMTMMMYPNSHARPGEEGREDDPSTSQDEPLRSVAIFRGHPGLSISINDKAGSLETGVDNADPKESPVYEDQEFNFNRRTLRKSSSLKTNKTPPGTPHRKKAVRFADAMGLDLESVRHVLNQESPPKIPASAMADLKQGLEEDRVSIGSRYLIACFSQPGASDGFVQSVLQHKVRLENAIITDLTITGFIRVANIAYHKNVRIRYTHNKWTTFHDIGATYLPNSYNGPTDRFSFSIVAPSYFVQGDRLECAVSFSAEGVEYWDNNNGRNYVFECFAKTVPTENENSWLHFL